MQDNASLFLLFDTLKLLCYFLILSGIDDILFHIVIEQAAGVANIDGSLYFISCQDPYLDSSLFKRFNGFLHILLKLIFDSGRTY